MKNLKNKAMVKLAAVGTALAPVAAFAQEAGPDTSAITGKIALYSAAAVVLSLAFAGAVWAIRSAGLFKRG